MRAIATVLAIFGLVAQGNPIWKREFTSEEFLQLNVQQVFHEWTRDFNRNYGTIEESAHRYGIWLQNLERISQTNSQKLSYKLRLNQFADLTDDEFRAKVHGSKGACYQRNKKSQESQQTFLMEQTCHYQVHSLHQLIGQHKVL